MATINLLDKKVYNRISAGEVVERPASMVKELVENSLDAGATKIEITISGGGIDSVTVADNGCGIEKSQLERAFLPHATSKIKTAADLDAVFTLGFRGEALASIGAVTQAEIISKTAEDEIGSSIICDGGELGLVSGKTCETGTTVICRNLFFNTPARAKFLKTARAEEGEITAIVTKLAFSNPNVAFRLVADGKVALETYGGGLKECLASVYGAKTLEQCFYIENEKNGVKISGYIGKLSFTKPTRSYQTLIVNGRYVTDTTVSAAVQNAYSSYLMKRQYPVFVLNLVVPPEIVDVNVHPRKSEVRFSNNQIIYSAVYSSVSKVLDGVSEAVNIIKDEQTLISPASGSVAEKGADNTLRGEIFEDAKNEQKSAYKSVNGTFGSEESTFSDLQNLKNEQNQGGQDYKDLKNPPTRISSDKRTFSDEGVPKNDSVFDPTKKKFGVVTVCDSGVYGAAKDLVGYRGDIENGYAGSFESEAGVDMFAENKRYIERLEREKQGAKEQGEMNFAEKAEDNENIVKNETTEKPKLAEQTEIPIGANDVFVGQAFGTYLIFTRGEDMYFIDQHAAHERLLFDELCKKANSNSLEMQTLLVPFTFYCSAEDYENIFSRMDYFREIGVEISAIVSDKGFCVTALPIELCGLNLRKFFDDILYDNAFKREKMPVALKEKLMQTACKHAIKGGDLLDKTEIDALLKKVSSNLGLKCPHGRPIAIKITKTELEKWFKRIV